MATLTTGNQKHAQQRVKGLVKDLSRSWGPGWARIGSTMQEALLRAEMLAEINRYAHLNTDPAEYRDLVEELIQAAIQWQAPA